MVYLCTRSPSSMGHWPAYVQDRHALSGGWPWTAIELCYRTVPPRQRQVITDMAAWSRGEILQIECEYTSYLRRAHLQAFLIPLLDRTRPLLLLLLLLLLSLHCCRFTNQRHRNTTVVKISRTHTRHRFHSAGGPIDPFTHT